MALYDICRVNTECIKVKPHHVILLYTLLITTEPNSTPQHSNQIKSNQIYYLYTAHINLHLEIERFQNGQFQSGSHIQDVQVLQVLPGLHPV